MKRRAKLDSSKCIRGRKRTDFNHREESDDVKWYVEMGSETREARDLLVFKANEQVIIRVL